MKPSCSYGKPKVELDFWNHILLRCTQRDALHSASPAQLRGMLRHLPEAHSQGLREIEHDSGLYTPHEEEGRQVLIMGQYYRDDKIMFLGCPSELLLEVFSHELAHHVWYTGQAGLSREAWYALMQSSEPRPTAYAEKNCSEDFAESYSEFVLRPQRLKIRCPMRHGYMEHFFWSVGWKAATPSDASLSAWWA